MSSAPHIVAKPAPDISPDKTRDARARAWAFVFDCHAKKNAPGVTSTKGGDGTKFKEDSANAAIIPDE